MNTWILILMLADRYGGAITVGPFTSKENCVEAAKQIEKDINPTTPRFSCIKVGLN